MLCLINHTYKTYICSLGLLCAYLDEHLARVGAFEEAYEGLWGVFKALHYCLLHLNLSLPYPLGQLGQRLREVLLPLCSVHNEPLLFDVPCQDDTIQPCVENREFSQATLLCRATPTLHKRCTTHTTHTLHVLHVLHGTLVPVELPLRCSKISDHRPRCVRNCW